MQQRTNITQWFCNLIGIFAIGLLLRVLVLLPVSANIDEPGDNVSVLKSAQESDQSDCSPTLYTHLQKALVSRSQTSFPLTLTGDYLIPSLTFSGWVKDEPKVSFIPPASFYFLRLLFEHQISINAP